MNIAFKISITFAVIGFIFYRIAQFELELNEKTIFITNVSGLASIVSLVVGVWLL